MQLQELIRGAWAKSVQTQASGSSSVLDAVAFSSVLDAVALICVGRTPFDASVEFGKNRPVQGALTEVLWLFDFQVFARRGSYFATLVRKGNDYITHNSSHSAPKGWDVKDGIYHRMLFGGLEVVKRAKRSETGQGRPKNDSRSISHEKTQ